MAIAEDLLAIHDGATQAGGKPLPAHMAQALRETLFYVVPRISPDGTGPYPGSAPETRAVLDFATGHPNIMVWLNLHTFGGVLIRPLGHGPEAKMDPVDPGSTSRSRPG